MLLLYKYREILKEYSTAEILKKAFAKGCNKSRNYMKCFFYKAFSRSLHPYQFENFRTSMTFFFSNDNRLIYKSFYSNEEQKEIIKQADKICEHIFNLLGSGDAKLGSKIDWSCDFKTGFIWPKKYHKLIKTVNLLNNSDVKVPWELSRFHHIFTLGKAYWLSKDTKYALEFKAQIEHWIDENPVEMSVNWTCPMDVAIRAVNWITGYYFFESCEQVGRGFWETFNCILYQHATFIRNNLENKDNHTSNHYISNLVGLIWLGLYFKELKSTNSDIGEEPDEWLEFALTEIEKEMQIQVNCDGTSYEASTSYHRLVTELFLLTAVLCSKNNIGFSYDFKQRLEKMCEFVLDITKPNGLSPLIGDADDGRLLIISNYPGWVRSDFRHILAVAGEYYDRDDFRYAGRLYFEDAIWIAGKQKYIEDFQLDLKSKAYGCGGYFILRNSRICTIIRCGSLSFNGQGGHSHNDQLSFELNVDGEDMIIDPGVFVYTSDYKMRNIFRSTEVHNTVVIEGIEQNDYIDTVLFKMQEQSFGKCLNYSETQFTGRHYGYKEKAGLVHNRTIKLEEDGIVIIDELNGRASNYNAFCKFTLSNDISVRLFNKKCILSGKQVEGSIITSDPSKIRIIDTKIAKQYGRTIDSKKVEVSMKNMNNIRFVFRKRNSLKAGLRYGGE